MKRSAYDFAHETEKRIQALSDDEPKHFFERPRPAKRLIEEIYPLSKLALRFQQLGAHVEVEAFENSGQADGHIWIESYAPREFDVQVTFAGYDETDKLRARHLLKHGWVPGSGPIHQDKKTGEIIAEVHAEDVGAPIQRIAASIRKSYLAKAAKGYPPETVLLIAFDVVPLQGRGYWKMLYDALDEKGGIQAGVFTQVFLFNGASNELQQVA